MSRSIHTTHRFLHEESHFDYADVEVRRQRLEQLKKSLGKKQRIKARVRQERGLPVLPVPALARDVPDGVPIEVVDHHPFLHCPATPDHLRAVLSRLPAGVADGVDIIELGLGLDRQVEPEDGFKGSMEPDPYTGRNGFELCSGVYSGRVLGTYTQGGTVRLFGYVYDSNRADRKVLETYLTLQMLSTFVHELGHHDDMMRRVKRGRWLADHDAKVEVYAESVQYEWTREVVIPYLEQVHADDVEELRAWIEKFGGLKVTLEALASDPRTTIAKGGAWLFFSVAGAFESLLDDVGQGKSLSACRIGFAENLHFGDSYDEALAVLALVLGDEPENLEAHTLQADIYAHQERYEEAEKVASFVAEKDPSMADAWMVLADVADVRGDHALVEAHAGRAYEILKGQEAAWTWPLRRRARARLAQRNWQGVFEDLDVLLNRRATDELTLRLKAIALLRSGRVEEAFELAEDRLAAGKKYYVEYVAVRFHSAHLLGRPEEAGVLTAVQIETIRGRGHAEWIEELGRDCPGRVG